MQSVSGFRRRRFRTPQADGQALVEPPFGRVADVLIANADLARSYDLELGGRPLADLARLARREFLAAAHASTREYIDLPEAYQRRVAAAAEGTAPVFVAGHQPRLFHPGVWFKNFALSRLASEHDGVGVNLIIDSDAVGSPAIRVPAGDAVHPTISSIPLDQTAGEVPFEQRQIQDAATFAAFGKRATAALASLVTDPLVASWWPEVVRSAGREANLGRTIAQARHRLEARWGLVTLEAPQSVVCGLESFAWLVAHLVARPRRTSDVYNAALTDYRRANRIRSRSHPVPNLSASGEWFETPFWVWNASDPARRGLFARRSGRGVALSNLAGWETTLDRLDDSDAASAAQQLRTLADSGVKIRTRAITTTLFARLLLGDLFLHGIGGAKYDELTDLVIQRLFHLDAPGYMVLSATVRLPVAGRASRPEGSRRIRHELRELVFHPEHYLDRELAGRRGELDQLEEAVARKLAWIRAPISSGGKARHQGIVAANAVLARWVEPARAALASQQADAADAEAREAILGSREYAFCLFPEERLRSLLLELSGASP